MAVACSISGILAFALPIPIIIQRFQVEQENVLNQRSDTEKNANKNPYRDKLRSIFTIPMNNKWYNIFFKYWVFTGTHKTWMVLMHHEILCHKWLILFIFKNSKFISEPCLKVWQWPRSIWKFTLPKSLFEKKWTIVHIFKKIFSRWWTWIRS